MLFPEEYQHGCEEEYFQLVLDSTFPLWRNYRSAFLTLIEYDEWCEDLFDDAMVMADIGEITQPTFH